MNNLLEHLQERWRGPRLEVHAGEFVAFEDWSSVEISAVLALGEVVEFSPGTKLIELGSEADHDIYIIVSGELEVVRTVGEVEQRLSMIQAGDLIGEMSFVDGQPRSADVRALKRTKALRIRPDDLESFCQANPHVGLKFMREIAKILSFRLRTTL